MEKKVLKDDLEDNIIGKNITNKKKRGRYWMVTLYNEDLNQELLEKYANAAGSYDSIFKHLQSYVAQVEVGEVSGEKHMHMAITFTDSTFAPVAAFYKVFGEDIYISSTSYDMYDSYCNKNITRLKDTLCVIYGIKEKEIREYERPIKVEEISKDKEESKKNIEYKENIEKRLLAVEEENKNMEYKKNMEKKFISMEEQISKLKSDKDNMAKEISILDKNKEELLEEIRLIKKEMVKDRAIRKRIDKDVELRMGELARLVSLTKNRVIEENSEEPEEVKPKRKHKHKKKVLEDS